MTVGMQKNGYRRKIAYDGFKKLKMKSEKAWRNQK